MLSPEVGYEQSAALHIVLLNGEGAVSLWAWNTLYRGGVAFLC
jgi:hypothetical protein